MMPLGKGKMLFEAVFFVIAVLFFNAWELRRPRNHVDRKHGLALNIMSMLIVIFAGEMWKALLVRGFDPILPLMSSFVYIHALPGTLKILMGIILTDFTLYWVHRSMHEINLLWRTHKFHHSIYELWWLSGARTSITHLFMFALPQTFIAYYLLALDPIEISIAFSFGILINIWVHTNIWVNLGALEWLFITPNYHRVHHGAKGLSRRNLGFVFTVWDRIFGTYVDPRTIEKESPLGFVATSKGLLRMVIGI